MEKVTVVRVIDGDTVKLSVEGFGLRRVRLSGIDAPETAQISGGRSTAFLEDLLKDKDGRFFVKFTETPARQGRLYGLLYREGDTEPLESINAKMVAAGWAHACGMFPQDIWSRPVGEGG